MIQIEFEVEREKQKQTCSFLFTSDSLRERQKPSNKTSTTVITETARETVVTSKITAERLNFDKKQSNWNGNGDKCLQV